MYYKIVSNNEITGAVKDNGLSIPCDENNTDYQALQTWLTENNKTLEDLQSWPVFSQTEKKIQYIQALFQHFNNVARQKDYASSDDCASFVSSKKKDWSAQAVAFIDWRDDVWGYALLVLSEVEAGTMEPPNVDEFINGLPAMVWP